MCLGNKASIFEFSRFSEIAKWTQFLNATSLDLTIEIHKPGMVKTRNLHDWVYFDVDCVK